MSSVSPATQEAAQPQEGSGELLALCLDRTIEAFLASGVATAEETEQVRTRFQRAVSEEAPRDAIEILARVQGAEEEHVGNEVARISHAVAGVIPAAPPLIPFAGKLMAPSAFYEAYTKLHELARDLLSPVIFAEDTDAIGTGSLNPVAATIMGEEILKVVNRRFAIRPFVTTVRLDYESWSFLSRKHFGL